MSVTVRLDARVIAPIAGIGNDAWTAIEYTERKIEQADAMIEVDA